MATIEDLYNNLKSLNLRKEVPVIIQETSGEIISLNKQQLNQGIDSTGGKIKKRYKSTSYAKKKNEMNPIPGYGVPDLSLTGDFYRGVKVLVDTKDYLIYSDDSKSDKLEEKYGKQIFGLDQDNKKEYAQGKLYDGIKNYVEGKTGLKFK